MNKFDRKKLSVQIHFFLIFFLCTAGLSSGLELELKLRLRLGLDEGELGATELPEPHRVPAALEVAGPGRAGPSLASARCFAASLLRCCAAALLVHVVDSIPCPIFQVERSLQRAS